MLLRKLNGDLTNLFRQPFGFSIVGNEPGGGAAPNGTPGQSADTNLDGSISDLDLKPLEKLSEVEKKAVIDGITSKVKNLEALATKGREEVVQKEKAIADKEASLNELLNLQAVYNKNPILKNKIDKAFDDYRTGNLTDSTSSKTISSIDKAIEEADTLEQKEALRQSKQWIQEISKPNETSEELRAIREELAILKSANQSYYSDRADRGVNELTSKFGTDVVGKYDTKLRQMMMKYPQKPGESFDEYSESIFMSIANSTDRRAAYTSEAKIKESKVAKRQVGGLSPDLNGTTTPIEVPRDKAGRPKIRELVTEIVNKKGLAQLVKGL